MYSPPTFPGTKRETYLQMEISFISTNIPNKGIISTLFSGLLLYMLFLKTFSSKGTWVVQLTGSQAFDFGSGHDLRVLRSRPMSGSVLNTESA